MNDELLDRIRARLVAAQASASAGEVARALRAEGVLLGERGILDLVERLGRELDGAGCLAPLLALPGVTDVLVNGADQVWMDTGAGLQQVEVTFRDEAEVRRLAQRLAAQAGRRLDEASPFVDARLPDGTRLHAVIPPITEAGTHLSLRVPGRERLSMADLVRAGSVNSRMHDLLMRMLSARLSFLISGGTGAGKTTVLGALLGALDPQERVVIIEDSAELRPVHPHLVRMQARPANVEGAGGVSLRDLMRQTLRMRPDRIVVGEVRGAEVLELLMALNTGHEGGCGTVHANSAADVPARIEALGLLAGVERTAIHSLMRSGIDVIVHVQRDREGVRRVSGMHTLVRDDSGLARTAAVLELDVPGDIYATDNAEGIQEFLRRCAAREG